MVQYFTFYFCFHFLGFDEPVFQSAAETRFHAEHRDFGDRSSVVADATFPAFATIFADVANRFVAFKRRQLAVAVSLDLRILTRRDHLFHAAIFQSIANLPRVIRTVAVKTSHLVARLFQHRRNRFRVMYAVVRQHVSYDFLRVCVDHQVQVSPRATLAFAMRPGFPFAFAKHFQTGAVNDDIGFTPFFTERNADVKFFPPLAQGRITRNRQFQLQDAKHPSPETFGPAIRQREQLTHRQQCFDGQIAESQGAALSLIFVFVLPLRQNVVGEPEGDVVAVDQCLVLFCPVSDFVSRACFRTHGLLCFGIVFDS